MADIYPKAWLGEGIVDFSQASVSIASSAVLYGLSVYTVFPVNRIGEKIGIFRMQDHYDRMLNSAKIMGLNHFIEHWTFEAFEKAISKLITSNSINHDVLVRATVHGVAQLSGAKSRDIETILSMFIYKSGPILPLTGARIKSSVWRRVPDNAIPARAKVNGAYVNSVLAKQDALDSGYDDCLFLDGSGHVCELSAANIFLVRHGKLITPDSTSDLLEGINRRTIIEVARAEGIEVVERPVDLTELYIADEILACGTSAYVAPIIEVDARQIGTGKAGKITQKIAKLHHEILHGQNKYSTKYLTYL